MQKIITEIFIISFILWPQLLISQKPAFLDQASFENIEELSLNEILTMDVEVITSGKQSMPLREVPEAIHILSAEDIRRSGATTIPELLRLIPGMEIVQLTPAQFNITARSRDIGTASNETMVLIDSRPTYMAFFRSMTTTGLPINFSEIERIEVVVGPGSMLYGSNAVKGVVNIITKRPDYDDFNLSIANGIQTNDIQTTYTNIHAHTTASKKWSKNFSTRLGLSYLQMHPWNKATYQSTGNEYKNLINTNITFHSLWTPEIGQELSFRAGYNFNDGDGLPQIRFENQFSTYYADIAYNHSHLFFDNDYFDIRLYDRGGTYKNSIIYDSTLGVSQLDPIENIIASNILYRFYPIENAATSIGVDIKHESIDLDELRPEGRNLFFYSFYILERIKLFKKFIANVGIRLDGDYINEKNRSFLLPQASLVYTPNHNHSIRLSVGKAMKYNSPFERFADLSFVNGVIVLLSSTPEIDPLEMISIEGGYQWFINKKMNIKIDIFFNKFNNYIDIVENPNPNSLYYFLDIDDPYYSVGTEVTYTMNLNKWANIKAAYAYSFTEGKYYDQFPPNPQHKIYFTWSSNPLDKLEIDMNFYFQSYYQSEALYGGNIVVNPVEILNMRIAYQISRNVSLYTTIHNLLDISWGTTFSPIATDAEAFYEEADIIGRRFMLGITANF